MLILQCFVHKVTGNAAVKLLKDHNHQ